MSNFINYKHNHK